MSRCVLVVGHARLNSNFPHDHDDIGNGDDHHDGNHWRNGFHNQYGHGRYKHRGDHDYRNRDRWNRDFYDRGRDQQSFGER